MSGLSAGFSRQRSRSVAAGFGFCDAGKPAEYPSGSGACSFSARSHTANLSSTVSAFARWIKRSPC